MEACHFPDRNPHNNHVGNLRWDTRKANLEDARKHGTMPLGEQKYNAKLTDDAVRDIRAKLAAGSRQKDMAKNYGVARSTILNIVRGTCWKHVPTKDDQL